MACLTQIVCALCHQPSTEAIGSGQMPPSVCSACQSRAKTAQRTAALDALKALSLEERLARIEAWMYDHGQVQHGYVEAPRF